MNDEKLDFTDAVDECLEGFNFEAVHEYMKGRGWQWVANGVYARMPTDRVPTPDDLKAAARAMLDEAAAFDGPTFINGSGGLYAIKDEGDTLMLVFVPYSSDAFARAMP